MKTILFLLFSLCSSLFILLSCGGESPASANLKTDIAGTWTVTRTLVTPSTDFPQGYQDQQEWTFSVNGDNCVLTNIYGSIQGVWGKSVDFNYDHWIFQATGNDPKFGFKIKVIVEIIAVDKLKGTNEIHFWDEGTASYLLLDGFKIEGVRK